VTVTVSFFGTEDQEQQDREDEQRRKYYGIYSAEVISLLDPFMMGRVQVRMKSFDPLDLQAWARVVTPMAGTLHGAYFVPSVGDEVVIAFEAGDLHAPYIIGSVHNFTHPAPVPSPLAQIRALRSPLGNQLVFSEAGPAAVLQSGPTPPATVPAPPTPTAPYSSLVLSPAGAVTTTPGVITLMAGGGIMLQCGDSSIAVTPAGVLINGKLVGVAASGTASVVAPSVRINS
jgi:hypothetical protein